MLNYEYPPLGGGAGPVAKEIAEQLVKRGHHVDLVTMHFRGLPKKEVINGVVIHRVPAIRKKKETCETPEMLTYVLSAIPYCLKLSKNESYDIIHDHFIIPTGLVAYVLRKIRGLQYIISVHGSDVPGYNPDRFTRQHAFTKPLLRMIIRNAKLTVPLSNHLSELIKKNISDSYPLQVIPNGININKFSIRKKKKQLLMAGRLLQRKGFQHVLLSLQGIANNEWSIHILGDGPYRGELEKLAKGVSMDVTFHGWLANGSDQFNRLFEESSIFCLPSSNENASIALLEAMLCEMAVVTSNVTGCPETVGDTGFTVNFADVEKMGSILQQLMHNPDTIATLGARARQRVLENYDWEIIIGRYLGVLQG